MNNVIKKILHKSNDGRTPPASTFKELVEEVAKNGGGAVKLYRKDDQTNGRFFVAEKDVKDMKDVEPEQWIKNGYGGGNYIVEVLRENEKGGDRIAKDFRFSINGEPKEGAYESFKRKNADQDMASSMTKEVLSFAKELMPQKDDSAIVALIQSNAQQNQLMMQQFMESQKSQLDMMIRMMENSKKNGNPVNETIEAIMQLSQVKDMLTPNVETDKTLEWAKLILGNPIASGIMGKITGAEIPIQKSLPLVEVQKPGISSLSSGLGNPAEISETRIGEPANPDISTPPGGQATVAPLISTEKDDFESVMIDPIIELINSHAEPADVAQAIHQVINWTMTSIKANYEPHPIMIEFIQAIISMANGNLDVIELDKAYVNFAHTIEMPEQLINPVKDELVKLYMPMLLQMRSKAKPIVIDGEETKNETSSNV